jgi:hypothetical protein
MHGWCGALFKAGGVFCLKFQVRLHKISAEARLYERSLVDWSTEHPQNRITSDFLLPFH